MIFYAGFVLGLLVLPRFRHMFAGGIIERPFLLKISLVLTAITVLPVAIGFAAPEFVHNALVGAKYSPDAGLLQQYLIGTALLTTALLLTYLIMAAGWNWIAYGLLSIASAQIVFYVSAAHTTYDFARILIVGGAVMCVFLGVVAVALLRSKMGCQQLNRLEADVGDQAPPVTMGDLSTRDPI